MIETLPQSLLKIHDKRASESPRRRLSVAHLAVSPIEFVTRVRYIPREASEVASLSATLAAMDS